MIEYDDKGKRVYQGGYVLDKTNGYLRNGEGSEYMNDGESALYIGHFEKGMRSGEGTSYCDGYPQYVGEWKNGLKNGQGKEYDKNGNIVKQGTWNNGTNSSDCNNVILGVAISYIFLIGLGLLGVVSLA